MNNLLGRFFLDLLASFPITWIMPILNVSIIDYLSKSSPRKERKLKLRKQQQRGVRHALQDSSATTNAQASALSAFFTTAQGSKNQASILQGTLRYA